MDAALIGVNWLAVLLGAALGLGLAALWFGPIFGKDWAAGSHNITAPERMPRGALGLQLAGTLLMSWLIGAAAAQGALMTQALLVLTIGALNMGGSLFSLKSTRAAMIDGGFVLAMGAVMIAVQGLL